MKVSNIAYSALVVGAHMVNAYPGEIIYSCAVTEKEWEGEYTPWEGNTKNAHAHLTFDDGPFVGITDTILDVLKEKENTKATFFLVADNLNEDTRYLVDRMINEVCLFCIGQFHIPRHISSVVAHVGISCFWH